MKRAPAAVLLAAVMFAAAGCARSGPIPRATKGLQPAAKQKLASGPVPAWARRCLPKGSQRLGPAPRYVGLTPRAANRLNNLVYAGGGGRCSTFDDDVYRSHPVAVVINTRLIGTRGARIIAAVRAAPGWEPGARNTRTIHYEPEGVTLTAAPAGYRPSVSRRQALALFRRSGLAGSGTRRRATVKLWTVSGRHSYPAWVITFPHTRPVSYGLASSSEKPDCAWVSIFDLRTRVWTEDFQNCPGDRPKAPSCDSGCTPANQPALDAAASYAESVASAAHCYTGTVVDDAANRVIVYLAHAPQSVLDELRARHPGIYVIHNDAPRTLHSVMRIAHEIDPAALKSKGIDVAEWGPTQDGHLRVGVSSNVAKAQAFFDAEYGRGVVRVVHGELPTAASATG